MSNKRASMHDGPLADLFRATDAAHAVRREIGIEVVVTSPIAPPASELAHDHSSRVHTTGLVIEARRTYAAATSNARHGRTVTEIMMALFESARKRRRIKLPLLTKVNPLSLMVENGDLPVEWPGAYERRARLVRGEGMSWHGN